MLPHCCNLFVDVFLRGFQFLRFAHVKTPLWILVYYVLSEPRHVTRRPGRVIVLMISEKLIRSDHRNQRFQEFFGAERAAVGYGLFDEILGVFGCIFPNFWVGVVELIKVLVRQALDLGFRQPHSARPLSDFVERSHYGVYCRQDQHNFECAKQVHCRFMCSLNCPNALPRTQ